MTDDRRLEPGLVTEVAPLERAQELVDELRRPGTQQLKVLLQP